MTNSISSSPKVTPQIIPQHTEQDSASLASTELGDHEHPVHLHDEQTKSIDNVPSIPLDSVSRSTTRKTNTVPHMEKRGLLATVVVIPEYVDARDYPSKIKFMVVFIIAFASITGPMGTSIMLPAIDDITVSLNTTTSIVNVSVGIYLLALGIFPLWWSAFSEKYGRRSVYIISFGLFVAFSIGTSLAPNIAALIIFRVFQGGCSASVQAVGAGTIADLFIPQERGVAMGWYYLGPLMGPFLAPILGGVVAQVWGWRATQWLLVIFSGCNFVLLTFFLPETLRRSDNLKAIKDLLRQQNKELISSTDDDNTSEHTRLERILSNPSIRSAITQLSEQQNQEEDIEEEEGPVVDPVMPTLSRLNTNKSTASRRVTIEDQISKVLTETGKEHWKTTLYDLTIRPMHSLVLLKYPPVALVVAFSAITFAILYFFNMTITYSFARAPYNFHPIIIGLLYIPNSVTYVIASIIGGRWNDYLFKKYQMTHNGNVAPESRMSWNIVLAMLLYPSACLIFGWTLKYGTFWVVPLVGTALFGFSTMLVIGATVTYLVDTLPGKGATGVALNNLIRMILAAIATFIVEPLLRAIGPGILFSILTGILIVSSSILIYLKKRGDYFREHYDIGELYDKL
ncbi:MFS antiporter QDR3 [Spathaspora sp. JA1]|nr:MFS antiporter QDR3 [Spathaspora sp. JA1]